MREFKTSLYSIISSEYSLCVENAKNELFAMKMYEKLNDQQQKPTTERHSL